MLCFGLGVHGWSSCWLLWGVGTGAGHKILQSVNAKTAV